MDCTTLKRNIVFIADGSLPAHEMQQAHAHLDTCNACSQLMRQYSFSMTIHPSDMRMPRAETFFEDIMSKTNARHYAKQKKSSIQIRYSMVQPLLAAASIAVVIFLGIHLVNSSKENLKQRSTVDARTSELNALASQYQMKDNGTDEVDTYYLNK